MRFHNVEVDDEVFQLVKSNAEPLVDTFNSALRRLLSLTRQTGGLALASRTEGQAGLVKRSSVLPSVQDGTPQALRQILEVVQLVRSGAYTRTAATSFVAKQHNIFPQTVIDKYCRQLSLTATEFSRLLEQPDLSQLRELLKSKFPEHGEMIDEILTSGVTRSSSQRRP